jgi:sugar phosphate isomerase/epimerase
MARLARFGVSTHLFHAVRLTREHLLEISRHGFRSVELRATRTHVDYHSDTVVADLQQWLAEAGLELRSVHAPIGDTVGPGRQGQPINLAAADAEARAEAVDQATRALHIARRIPFQTFVVHCGALGPAADNRRDAARRSLELLHARAEPLGVRLALETIPNELSRAGSLVHFVEQVLDDVPVGICLDLGHAHLVGDLADTIETVSEHLVSVDVHDNRGRHDDHLVPFDGTIDWPSVMTTLQKIGYDGALMMELQTRGPARDTLGRARTASEKLEKLIAL